MSFVIERLLGGKNHAVGLLILAVLIIFPAFLDTFRLNLMGKYLTYAFAAVSLVLLWGYGGILSLGQGIFFGLGGYAMAMFLKLEPRIRKVPVFRLHPASRILWTGINFTNCPGSGCHLRASPLLC